MDVLAQKELGSFSLLSQSLKKATSKSTSSGMMYCEKSTPGVNEVSLSLNKCYDWLSLESPIYDDFRGE